jgi:hypothetical protein
MSTTTAKENLVAFAFAYFMVSKPKIQNDQTHYDNWNDIFKNFLIKDVKSTYKSHLESTFDYARVKSEYSYDKKHVEAVNKKLESIEDQAKKEQEIKKKSNAHIYTVYYQIQELYFSPFIIKSKNYRIYTQSSKFTTEVKDYCIKKLHKVFGLGGQYEMLSPVDFFIVNYDKKVEIEKQFRDNIWKNKNETDILINYEKNKDKTYEHIITKYFGDHDLIPVSHKLPEGKRDTAAIKLSGNKSKLLGYNRKYIDPYSELVIALQNKTPSEIDTLINKVIDINYDKWDMRDNIDSASWTLFFNFNFKELNRQFNNAEFGLDPLPGTGSGSYNGKFYTKGVSTPWVAGMAPKSVEQFIKQYPGYGRIMQILAKRREKCFIDVVNLSKINITKSSKGKTAINFLNQNKFQSFAETKKSVLPYFVELGQPNLFQDYQNELIKTLKREGGYVADVGSIKDDTIRSNHYVSIQMAYLWLFGGRNMQMYLKKKIFFTIFGAITKRSFSGITGTKLINLAKKEYKDKAQDIKVSITSAPHVVLM